MSERIKYFLCWTGLHSPIVWVYVEETWDSGEPNLRLMCETEHCQWCGKVLRQKRRKVASS